MTSTGDLVILSEDDDIATYLVDNAALSNVKEELELTGCVIDSVPIERNEDYSLKVAAAAELAGFVELCKHNRSRGIALYPTKVEIKSSLIAALAIKFRGRVARMADSVNVTTAAMRRYVNDRQALRELVESFDELRVEEAEDQLDLEIRTGDNSAARVAAAKFLLSTKGKDRGYTPRIETVGSSITVSINKSIYEGEGGPSVNNKY